MSLKKTVDIERLNPEQKAAVLHNHLESKQPLRLIAGAGSGKTSTITASVAYRLEQGTPAKRILMMTFTNKAAKHMIRKIEEYSDEASNVVAGTFHSIAYKLLFEVGYPRGFYRGQKILGDYQMQRVWEKAYTNALTEEERSRISEAKLGGLGQIQRWNSLIILSGNTLEDLPRIIPASRNWDALVPSAASKVILEYKRMKFEFSALDFDDVLSEFHRMLLVKELGDIVRGLFDYIYVDEYQDTSTLQACILKEIVGTNPRLTVVGDVQQSIFAFLSATIGNIMNFDKEFENVLTIKLNRNYRSTKAILDLSNKVISYSTETISNPLKAGKEQHRKGISGIVEKPVIHKYGSPQTEALGVLRDIQDALARGYKPKDIAILTRQSMNTYSIEAGLAGAGIDYVKVGGLKLTAKLNIRQFIAFLELVLDKDNWLAWETLIPMVPMLGSELAQVLIEDIKGIGGNWSWKDMPPLSIGSGKRYHSFKEFWGQISKIDTLQGATKGTFFKDAFKIFKPIYERYWNSTTDKKKKGEEVGSDNTLEDRLKEIEEYIVDLGTQRNDNLHAFLAQFQLDDSLEATKEVAKDVVTVSTIHSAKGLEWPVVFVIGVEQGSLPVDGREYGKGVVDTTLYPDFRPYVENAYIEEERRLFYVAITRAETELHITYSSFRLRGRKNSPFLQPFLPKQIYMGKTSLPTHDFVLEKMRTEEPREEPLCED